MSDPMADTTLHDQITSILREALQVEVPSVDTDLIAIGVLDSLAIVTIIGEIEERLCVELPLDELDVDSFRTVASMADFVDAGVTDRGAA
jgi:acyl carrier protein